MIHKKMQGHKEWFASTMQVTSSTSSLVCNAASVVARKPSGGLAVVKFFLSSFMLVPSLLYRCDSFDLFT